MFFPLSLRVKRSNLSSPLRLLRVFAPRNDSGENRKTLAGSNSHLASAPLVL